VSDQAAGRSPATGTTPATGTPPVTVSFGQATTQLDAIQRAVYALAGVMTVDVSAAGQRYACTLFPRDPSADTAELAHRLRSEVNDQGLRLRIAAETEPLRNLIFAVAFSQTGLAGDEPPPAPPTPPAS
jgi:His-Xaa-Ser system protein HxsD